MSKNHHHNHSISEATINALSGAFSGIVVSVTMSPLDVVKTRLQVSRKPKGQPNAASVGLSQIVKELYKEEGLRAFYKGMGTTMIGYAPNWAIYFTTYKAARSMLQKHIETDFYRNIASSVTAGAISNILTSPIWTIRTRMQTQIDHTDYKGTTDAFKKVVSREGIGALYRGVIPSMIGLIHVGIQFPLYEYLKDEALKRSNSDHLSTSHVLFASSLSKIVASVTAYPHEVLRSRLQDHDHSRNIQQPGIKFVPYSNLRHAIRNIWQEEGIRGFYRGLDSNLIRTVPAAVITLWSYEMSSKFLKGMFLDQEEPPTSTTL